MTSNPPPIEAPTTAARLAHLAEVWRSGTVGPARRLALAGLLATVFVGAHLSRRGTVPWRVAAAALLVAWASALAWATWRRARAGSSTRGVLVWVVARADPEGGARALRAAGLLERARTDRTVGSSELAALHFERSVARVSVERVRERAEARGTRVGYGALAALALAAAAVALGPLFVIEGLDVALAGRDKRAPVPLTYLDPVQVEVHAPDYLHERDAVYFGSPPGTVPYGSAVTVRGELEHPGRQLVLTDGENEVPFDDDGRGAVAARWTLTTSARLRVAARFGEVRVEQSDALDLRSRPDAAPVVRVDDTPRTVKLIEVDEIPIVYRASDDHGLREVDLVMRAGGREERRVLSRLDGDTRADQGGTVLRPGARFLRASYVPVEVTVEARDNDPLTGPKWGKSATIVVVPPAVGEPEALRYGALVAARDALVDALAASAGPTPATPAARAARKQALGDAIDAVTAAMSKRYGGLNVPKGVSALVAKRAKGVRAALASGSTTKPLEDATLSLDAAVRALGARDARSVARRMSEIATEAAEGFRVARSPDEAGSGLVRADAATGALGPAGKALARLGPLGADLGSIVANDLRRIARTRDAKDFEHAELAARDLAARLSRPVPSFAGGGRGGVESGGGGKPQPGEEGEGEGEGEGGEGSGDGQEQAVAELSRDHAGNVAGVAQAAQDGERDDDPAARDEAKKHADAIREAVRRLPSDSGLDRASSAAATGREQALQMADALERGAPRDAIDAGKAASKSLDESARAADQNNSFGQTDPLARQARDASSRLGAELKWAEEELSRARKRAEQKADLGGASKREGQLAERARDLAEKGRASGSQGSELVRDAEAKMRQAVSDLARGDVERGLTAQREAQKLLEMARDQGADPREGEGSGDQRSNQDAADGRETATGAMPIPKADEHKGPEEFRRRVLEGLGRGTDPRLKDAVRRYAERLLK